MTVADIAPPLEHTYKHALRTQPDHVKERHVLFKMIFNNALDRSAALCRSLRGYLPFVAIGDIESKSTVSRQNLRLCQEERHFFQTSVVRSDCRSDIEDL